MKTNLLFFLSSLFFLETSCTDHSPEPKLETQDSTAHFLLMTTVGEFGESNNAGYITANNKMLRNTISNVTKDKTLQHAYAYGFRQFGNAFYTRTNTAGQAGIQRYIVNKNGIIQEAGFIANAGNFDILNNEIGYYFDEARGTLKLQRFNPTSMQRTGEIDLSSLKKAGVEYQSVGQNHLANKDGKLYAYITYATNALKGMGDELYDYVEFAVINAEKGILEKTIRYDGIKGIGFPSANKMYTIGDDGALYIYSTGIFYGFQNTTIIRIKKGESEFDKNWKLSVKDYQQGGTIATALIKNGFLYTALPSEAINPNMTNLDLPIYDYYAINLSNGQKSKIEGMPKSRYVWANDQAITEIDGKIYFWINNTAEKIKAYYVLEGTKATQVFNLADGGIITGFAKIN